MASDMVATLHDDSAHDHSLCGSAGARAPSGAHFDWIDVWCFGSDLYHYRFSVVVAHMNHASKLDQRTGPQIAPNHVMETLRNDIRYASRQASRSPVFML